MKTDQEELQHLITECAVLRKILEGAAAPEIKQAIYDRYELLRSQIAELAPRARSAA